MIATTRSNESVRETPLLAVSVKWWKSSDASSSGVMM
jgi:hypothetical protein